MPQMSGLLWLNLMIMFLISFYLFYSMIHWFLFSKKMEIMVKSQTFNQKSWKW